MKSLSLLVWLVLVVLFSFAALAAPNALQLAHGPAGHGSPLAPARPPLPSDLRPPEGQPSDAQGSEPPLSDAQTDAAWDLSNVAPEDMTALTQAPLAWSEIDWRGQLLSHWHNKLVHFPLVLGLVAALLRWRHWWQARQASVAQAGAALSQTQLQPSPSLYSVFLTATTALALLAALTGQQQAHPFMAGPLRQVLSLHQALGILSVLGFAALLWLDQRLPKQYLLLQTLGLSLLVALLWGTGLLGGLLAQSH